MRAACPQVAELAEEPTLDHREVEVADGLPLDQPAAADAIVPSEETTDADVDTEPFESIGDSAGVLVRIRNDREQADVERHQPMVDERASPNRAYTSREARRK